MANKRQRDFKMKERADVRRHLEPSEQRVRGVIQDPPLPRFWQEQKQNILLKKSMKELMWEDISGPTEYFQIKWRQVLSRIPNKRTGHLLSTETKL